MHHKGCISLYQHGEAYISLSVTAALSISPSCLLQSISAQARGHASKTHYAFSKIDGVKKKGVFSHGHNQRGTIVHGSWVSIFSSLSGAFSLQPFTHLVSSASSPVIFHPLPLCSSVCSLWCLSTSAAIVPKVPKGV